MNSGNTVMVTSSSKPLQQCTSAAASTPPLISRCCPGVSWRWRRRRRSYRLQCSQSRQDSAARTRRDLVEYDRRLRQNAGIFHPSIWGDFFLGYSNPSASSQQQTQMAERADKLKEEVAGIIVSSTYCGLRERLHLIDTLERLCLDHLFEEEINAALPQIETADISDCDLGTVALCWDAKAAYDLPECMKFALGKILDSFQTIANMLNQEEKYRMSYLRYFIEDLVRSYNMEVKMLQYGYIPKSVEEHLQVSYDWHE
nr:unnamed protein product [Digitaria exilis]